MTEIDKIAQRLLDSKSIAVLYHVNADGDAIGSALAIKHAFSSDTRRVDVIGEEEVQNNLRFLPASNGIFIKKSPIDIYDTAIALDAGSIRRLESRIDIYNNAGFRINIDHHKDNNIPGDLSYVDTNAAASAEIIYKIIKAAGIAISQDASTCLFTGISTDTGNFKYSNTSPLTHRIAAELMENGIDSTYILKQIYENISFDSLRLLSRILQTIKLYLDNKVCFMEVSSDMISDLDIGIDDLDNTANYGLSVEDVELAVFFKGMEPNKTRVSFRSKYYFDCSDFAKKFNGGGHARASGCTIETSLEDSKKIVLAELSKIKFEEVEKGR